MHRLIITLLLCAHLLMPAIAMAQSAARSPLNISLREYGFMLAVALLGGLANWWGKVRRGELIIWNISALVGELCISAFAGLMAFYGCEYFGFSPWLTAAIVGMAGHAGARGIAWAESAGQRIAEKRLGIDPEKPKD